MAVAPSEREERELFFGLVGPVGTRLGAVKEALAKELGSLDYHFEEVKMSRLLEAIPAGFGLPQAPEDERIRSRMDAGDALRRSAGSGAALVYLAAIYIRQRRKELSDKPRRAFIFDSLKHPEELEALRRLYEESLVCISVFAPKADRIENLSRRIAQSRGASVDSCVLLAEDLVRADEAGHDQFGQSVRKTFPLADVFVRSDASDEIGPQICRVVELIFGNCFRTPTRDELGMFQARAVALRSADLSRQVGAVLADAGGSILASGCNEVPKAGGGTYWEGDHPDYRDFRHGRDPNAEHRDGAIREVVHRMRDAGWFTPDVAADEAELNRRALRLLDGTRIDSLIEFGRVVHAEMNALMDAAMRGVAVRNATLYCTTFPCHNCARHLLAAGVSRVVYIEPYPKSMARELYDHSLSVDEAVVADDRLAFDPFVGVAPRRFIPFFDLGSLKRKAADGFVKAWDKATAVPRFVQVFAAHQIREEMLVVELSRNVEAIGLDQKDVSDPPGPS